MLFSLNTSHVQASAPSHPVKANVFKGPGLKTGCPVWERELRLSLGTGFWKRQSLRIQSRKAFGKHMGHAEAACPSIPALVAFSFNPPQSAWMPSLTHKLVCLAGVLGRPSRDKLWCPSSPALPFSLVQALPPASWPPSLAGADLSLGPSESTP